MTWLVTGGAGYIGGHVVAALAAAGVDVVVLDDLSTGRADRLPAGVRLVRGQVGDRRLLDSVLGAAPVQGVVHLAALTSAPESVRAPLAYYQANVTDLATLLGALVEHGVHRIVASSSAAVYGGAPGEPAPPAFTEHSPTRPQNPYGATKLAGERLLADVAAAAGLATLSLRYFNVVGAAGALLADRKTGGLLPRVLAARSGGPTLTVHGTDHPTPDGSAVRDYVHVVDLAEAHLAAITHLVRSPTGTPRHDVLNIGSGAGYSVLQVLARAGALTGGPVPAVVGPRRPGDPAYAVADASRAAAVLGWRPRHDLDAAISSAWAAHQDQVSRTRPARHPAAAD